MGTRLKAASSLAASSPILTEAIPSAKSTRSSHAREPSCRVLKRVILWLTPYGTYPSRIRACSTSFLIQEAASILIALTLPLERPLCELSVASVLVLIQEST